MAVSRSSRALDAVLNEGGEEARALRDNVDRTRLWHYRTGSQKPSTPMAGDIERLSGGLVPANGWKDDALPASPPPDADAAEVAS